MSDHKIDMLQSELMQLKDLFQRRLLDDKVKTQLINELMCKIDGEWVKPLAREIILLIDRILVFQKKGSANTVEADDFIDSVLEELLLIMGHYGLERIPHSEAFDFTVQKATSIVYDLGMPDLTVLESVRAGYMYNGDILRPEEVIITRTPSAEVNADVEPNGR